MAPSFLWGGALARLLAQAEFPVLHTTVYRERLENFLLCTGGLHYVEALVNWLGWLARRVEGNVTLLHVVEPISLTYPLAEEVRAHWQELPQTDTPLGRHLQEAQRALEALGIPVRCGSATGRWPKRSWRKSPTEITTWLESGRPTRPGACGGSIGPTSRWRSRRRPTALC